MNELLNKYFTNSLSLTEKNELFDQINASEEGKKEFADMQILTALSEMAHQQGDEAWSQRKMKELKKEIHRKKLRFTLLNTLKYAAIVVVVVISTLFISYKYQYQHKNTLYTKIEVPKGQRVYLTLADGTEAWLSPRTIIKVPNEFNDDSRVVELDGEGYFSVTKDAKRPFIVKAGKYDIKVLGTKFNVFAYSESPKFEANLVEGSVHIYNRDHTEEGLFLQPNEKVYLENNRLIKSSAIFNNEEYLKNGIFSFTGIPFAEILDYLSLWYNVKFELKNAISLQHKVSGKFRQSDEVKDILKALQTVHRFKFKLTDDNTIEIY